MKRGVIPFPMGSQKGGARGFQVRSYYSESLDPDGRGHRNLIRMMIDDGFFKFLSKVDDAWVNFLKPFLKLSRKEKTNFRNKTKK